MATSSRKTSAAHKFWYPRVEGQIRDCMRNHPYWFSLDPEDRRKLVNSIAKRVVGEIVAGVVTCPNKT